MSDLQKKVEEKQAAYNELPKQPLLVRFLMSSPFSTTQYVRLDAIVARAGLIDAIKEEFFNLPDPTDKNMLIAPCPMERCENDAGQWWWSCSYGLPSYHRDQVTRWKKRWDDKHDDLVKFEGKLPRINHKAAYFKAYDMPLVIKNPSELVFCCVGNPGQIEKLLGTITHIGKKRSQGYGQIKGIVIKETKDNWSNYYNGHATRAIPLGLQNPDDVWKATQTYGGVLHCTYHPPYWYQPWATWCRPIGGGDGK